MKVIGSAGSLNYGFFAAQEADDGAEVGDPFGQEAQQHGYGNRRGSDAEQRHHVSEQLLARRPAEPEGNHQRDDADQQGHQPADQH